MWARLRTYFVSERPILDGYGADALCPSGRGQLLVPWPNRIERQPLRLRRMFAPASAERPERRNAMHGLPRWTHWSVADRAAARELEHCFTDLEREGDGRSRLGVGRTTLWADESYPYLMIFTGDSLPDVERRTVAVEPMTCTPNAFRSGEGVVRLEPGEGHVASWGIAPGR